MISFRSVLCSSFRQDRREKERKKTKVVSARSREKSDPREGRARERKKRHAGSTRSTHRPRKEHKKVTPIAHIHMRPSLQLDTSVVSLERDTQRHGEKEREREKNTQKS